MYFAGKFPRINWQPSDPDAEAAGSITAYRNDYEGENLLEPAIIDAAAEDWPFQSADAIVCINMVHISPWAATIGLFSGAARLLREKGAPVILYGPYFEQGIEPAPSNLEFDLSLKARNNEWGIRQISDVGAVAAAHGFERTARFEMPANNLTLVYRRS